MTYTRGFTYSAIFNPKNLKTLREELKPLVGKRFMFKYAWTQDDDESYPGQTAFLQECYDSNGKIIPLEQLEFGGRWIPEEDLDNIEKQKDE